MSACHAADRLAGLQGLFDKADLLVVTPSPPTLGAQHIDLHSRRDLKARLRSNPQAASQITQGGLRRRDTQATPRELNFRSGRTSRETFLSAYGAIVRVNPIHLCKRPFMSAGVSPRPQ